MVIETKQSYEDDDQAGILAKITGDECVKKMTVAAVADDVRLRILQKNAGDAARADHKHAAQGVSADAGNTLTLGSDGLLLHRRERWRCH